MPAIEVNQFKGLHDKPDGIIDDAGFCSDCENVIIYEGDICNMPPVVGSFETVSGPTRKGSFYTYEGFTYYIEFQGFPEKIKITQFVQRVKQEDLEISESSYSDFVPPSMEDRGFDKIFGRFFQINNWLIITGVLGDYRIRANTDALASIPYMSRLQVLKGNISIPTSAEIRPLGMQAPSSVRSMDPIDGPITGNMAFAVSFVSGFNTPGESIILGNDDLESNATLDVRGTLNLINAKIRLQISLPIGYDQLPPNTLVGVYSKLSTESKFHLFKYITPNSSVTNDPILGFIVTVVVQDAVTRDSTQPAAISGTETAHDFPQPSFHSDFFLNRMYYATVSPILNPGPVFSTTKNARNQLQISQTATLIDTNLDRAISYIWKIVLVGMDSEPITGVVLYGSQLIVFKQSDTWFLTTDLILGGDFKVLFSDRGCVSVGSNRGYIVVDRMLFFVDKDGIYMYNGQSDPVRISDPVRKFLDKLPPSVYSLVSLSIDPRYNLLYVNFPEEFSRDEFAGSLIFNYKEGTWTKTSPEDGIVDIDIENFPKRTGSLESTAPSLNLIARKLFKKGGFLGILEEEARDSSKINWFWKTVKLVLGKQSRRKHWKQLYIESEGSLTLDQTHIHANGEVKVINTKLEQYIGLHSKTLQIKFGQRDNQKPFRINGYELDAHIEGRR